jgi:hypothetical protein
MKRIKIMLLSLALFAVVGGALAFKARFLQLYCTAPTIGGACNIKYCSTLTTSTTIQAIDFACYTTPRIYTLENEFGVTTTYLGCYTNTIPGVNNFTSTLTCISSTLLTID